MTGEIPPELGRLGFLELLVLARNQLTGEIPPELGGLFNLTGLYLANNQLTGCIPEALRDIAENDLVELNLPDCTTATPPGAPTGLTATADGQTRIDLSWTAPSDDGGATITGYKVEVSTNGSSWSNLVANTNSTSASYTHSGLTAGSARHYRVSAINSAGTGHGVQRRRRHHRHAAGHQRLRHRRRRARCRQQPGAGVGLRGAAGRQGHPRRNRDAELVR